jgi:UDP-glucuronate 4-epimerase
MKVIVTGAAGFIGFHVCQELLRRGNQVLGIDNLNDYYDPTLKQARLDQLAENKAFQFHRVDVSDVEAVGRLFASHNDMTHVVHLAAQAGVRYSLINPYAYIDANVMGQLVMLEASRGLPGLENFVYASSSSVYGGNTKLPFSVEDRVDQPVSLYAATKRAGELIAECQTGLYSFPAVGLRFFTVYGPWGRPDMAAYIFTKAIFEGQPIQVFNEGDMRRDFTYIDDIVEGVLASLANPPAEADGKTRHKVYNLGNHKSEELTHFIEVLESACGREAIKTYADMQPGDVKATYADIEESRRDLGFEPRITIEEGLPRFVNWYRRYHGI